MTSPTSLFLSQLKAITIVITIIITMKTLTALIKPPDLQPFFYLESIKTSPNTCTPSGRLTTCRNPIQAQDEQ